MDFTFSLFFMKNGILLQTMQNISQSLFFRFYASIVFMSYHRFETGKRRYVGDLFHEEALILWKTYCIRIVVTLYIPTTFFVDSTYGDLLLAEFVSAVFKVSMQRNFNPTFYGLSVKIT